MPCCLCICTHPTLTCIQHTSQTHTYTQAFQNEGKIVLELLVSEQTWCVPLWLCGGQRTIPGTILQALWWSEQEWTRRLTHLNTWSLGRGTVRRCGLVGSSCDRVGGIMSLEWTLRFQILKPGQVSLSVSAACQFRVQM